MANNWQPPSAGSAGWAPRGLGLRGFMGGLLKGVSRWGERRDVSAAQRLAIQQYEAEKEEKRRQREWEKFKTMLPYIMPKAQAPPSELDVKEQELDIRKGEAQLELIQENIKTARVNRAKTLAALEEIDDPRVALFKGMKADWDNIATAEGSQLHTDMWAAYNQAVLGKDRFAFDKMSARLSTALPALSEKVVETIDRMGNRITISGADDATNLRQMYEWMKLNLDQHGIGTETIEPEQLGKPIKPQGLWKPGEQLPHNETELYETIKMAVQTGNAATLTRLAQIHGALKIRSLAFRAKQELGLGTE